MDLTVGDRLELPCTIRSLNSLGKGVGQTLISLLLPGNGIAVWPSTEDVTILKQSAAAGELKATLRARIVDETDEDYTAEIIDREKPRQIDVPKSWLQKELCPS